MASSGSMSPGMPPPPPGWQVHKSKSTGKHYYFNPKTGQSSYTFPGPEPKRSRVEPEVASAAAPAAGGGSYAAMLGVTPTPAAAAPAAATSATSAARLEDARALAVAQAYDAQPEQSQVSREDAKLGRLRKFQNWIKACLISQFCKREVPGAAQPLPARRVLDLACGKLGDLQKWILAGVQDYVGVDISIGQVRRAVDRISDSNRRSQNPFQARLVCADLSTVSLDHTPALHSTAQRRGVEPVPGGGNPLATEGSEQFDAISIQFALHYMFQSEARAVTFFRNIAGRLSRGGAFVATLPDADKLVRSLREEHASRMRAAATADPSCTDPMAATMPAPVSAPTGGIDPDGVVEFGPAGVADPAPATSFRSVPLAAAALSDTRASASNGAGAGSASGEEKGIALGNSIFQVFFPAETVARQYAAGGNPFGLRYNFFLEEAVSHVDEYLVPVPLLRRLASAAGLEMEVALNFHEFYARYGAMGPDMDDRGYWRAQGSLDEVLSPEARKVARMGAAVPTARLRPGMLPGGEETRLLLRRMAPEPLSEEEWAVAGVYKAFVFRRKSDLPITITPPPPPRLRGVASAVRRMAANDRMAAQQQLTHANILTIHDDGSWEGGNTPLLPDPEPEPEPSAPSAPAPAPASVEAAAAAAVLATGTTAAASAAGASGTADTTGDVGVEGGDMEGGDDDGGDEELFSYGMDDDD